MHLVESAICFSRSLRGGDLLAGDSSGRHRLIITGKVITRAAETYSKFVRSESKRCSKYKAEGTGVGKNQSE